jgi:hypothetical protein
VAFMRSSDSKFFGTMKGISGEGSLEPRTGDVLV